MMVPKRIPRMKTRTLVLFVVAFFCLAKPALPSDSSTREFHGFLKEVERRFAEYGWRDLEPEKIPWEYYRTTDRGRPLFFACFGNNSENCTILLAAIHGDEVPTIYVLFKLADYLKENPEAYRGRCVVIAPLVNPDGFLANPPQRVNSNGIDLNRNFPTKDWRRDALRHWETTAHKNKRYYPGEKPGSEAETRFLIALMRRFKPHKILSLHSPLGFYDFDGPSFHLDNFGKWLEKVSRETDYPLKKFGVYPGSLGNYAGLERGIFTVTLELPSSQPHMAEKFYTKFKPAVTKFMELGILGGKLLNLSE
jgi:protein MpaA